MKDLIVALQFLTRFSVGRSLHVDASAMVSATRMYPLVGLLIGMLLAGVYLIGGQLFGDSPFLVAALVVVAEILITGVLHLDGLMDTADGLWSWRPKDQILTIMKDSRVGANGVIALVCVLLLKTALISSLVPAGLWLLVLMPVLARWAVLFVAARYTHPYPQSTLGPMIIGQIPVRTQRSGTVFTGVILICLAAVVAFYDPKWVAVIGLLWLTSWFSAQRIADAVCRRIDGVTGDILGAVLELVEVLVLFVGIAALGWMV